MPVAAFPTWFLLGSTVDAPHADSTNLERLTMHTTNNGLDANKLELVEELAREAGTGRLSVVQADAKLAAIIDRRPLYSHPVQQASFALCGGACALLFYGGGWVDAAVGTGLGLMVGLMCLAAARLQLGGALEFVASFAVAAIARALATYVWPDDMCFFATALGALVWLFPGLSITTSVIEISSSSPLAGVARMFTALVTALSMGFGLALGSRLGNLGEKLGSYGCSSTHPLYVQMPAFMVVYLTFAVLMNAVRACRVACAVVPGTRLTRALPCRLLARTPSSLGQSRSQLFGMLITNVVAFLANTYAPDLVGPAASTVVAAAAIGAAGDLFRRITGKPQHVAIIAGVLNLVPGSFGVRGAAAIVDSDFVSGTQFGVSMMLTALSITIGLALASAFAKPARAVTQFRWFMTPAVSVARQLTRRRGARQRRLERDHEAADHDQDGRGAGASTSV